MQKDVIIDKLREQGFRITKQRRMLLDIILEEECTCCKEIYYKALKVDKTIGTATVYRMINTLEDIGAIRDLLVAQMILTHKTDAKEVLFYDHPTEIGLVTFER